MDFLATYYHRSRYSTIGAALSGYKPVVSNADVAFFHREGHYMVVFRTKQQSWWAPLAAILVHLGVMGDDSSYAYVTNQIRLLPEDATFSFVGDLVGAATALETFVQLPPELLDRVDEVHLKYFIPVSDCLRKVLDKHANKVQLMW